MNWWIVTAVWVGAGWTTGWVLAATLPKKDLRIAAFVLGILVWPEIWLILIVRALLRAAEGR